MIKIGITGSLASGKTTASKILSNKKRPLFSADKVVRKLYRQNYFRNFVAKSLRFKLSKNFKKQLKDSIMQKNAKLKKLEKIIHPLVRKEMFVFFKKNKSCKVIFFEIPLLVESKLLKFFDVVIFIKSAKSLRLKRYISRGGNIKLFSFLDHHQIKDTVKRRFCDHVVTNNKSLSILKKQLSNIIKLYE